MGLIWCLGMYASGSTWVYNAVRQTAAAAGIAPVSCYAETLKMLAPVRDKPGWQIVKTHDLDTAGVTYVTARAAAILLSVRDPRDAVTSLMQHMRHGFIPALKRVEQTALFCASFARDGRVRLLRYEDGFIDDPATFDLFAACLGTALEAGMRDALFAQTRRAVIDRKIAALESLPTTVVDQRSGDVVDLDTQWHRHHGNRTGEVGRWRRLLKPEEALLVEQRLGGWMRRFGYM